MSGNRSVVLCSPALCPCLQGHGLWVAICEWTHFASVCWLQAVSKAEGEALAKRYRMPFFETSAKKDIGVTEVRGAPRHTRTKHPHIHAQPDAHTLSTPTHAHTVDLHPRIHTQTCTGTYTQTYTRSHTHIHCPPALSLHGRCSPASAPTSAPSDGLSPSLASERGAAHSLVALVWFTTPRLSRRLHVKWWPGNSVRGDQQPLVRTGTVLCV